MEPPALTWTQLSQLLNWQFLTVGQRELDQDQLSQLREKFVGECFSTRVDNMEEHNTGKSLIPKTSRAQWGVGPYFSDYESLRSLLNE